MTRANLITLLACLALLAGSLLLATTNRETPILKWTNPAVHCPPNPIQDYTNNGCFGEQCDTGTPTENRSCVGP